MQLHRVLIFGLLVACGSGSSSSGRTAQQSNESTQPVAPPGEPTSPTAPTQPTQPTEAARLFDRVVIVMLENTDASRAMAEPYLADLAKRGASLNDFNALAHPSYPNYLALIAGTTFGVSDDVQRTFDARSVGDLLVEHDFAWKAYAEGYPGNCFLGESRGLYWRKHVPFLSLLPVQTNAAECARVVDEVHWRADVAADTLPAYALYVPDNNNNGHDTGVTYAAAWLKGFLEPLLADAKFMTHTLVVVTFDEAATYNAPNRIYAVLLGSMVRRGAASHVHYDLYSLLRTVEDNFELGTLGQNDQYAQPITDVWVR